MHMPFGVVRRTNEWTALHMAKSEGPCIGSEALKLFGFNKSLYG
jgi:hypothetical protein